jgi:type IX secretion system PorP/SprF family membrane protein
MKKRILFLSTLIVCVMASKLYAQDPHFSQFYSNMIYTNPAFTGASDYTRFSLNGRKQFTNVPNGIYTSTLSADMKINRTNSGLGFVGMFDQAGSSAYTTNSAGLIYSYKIVVNRRLIISSAVQASFVNRSIDRSKLIFGDELDANVSGKVADTRESINTPQRYYPNFSTGFLMYNTNFFAGIAIHNITQPNMSFTEVNSSKTDNLHLRKYTLHAGVNFYTNKVIRKAVIISPNVLFMNQGKTTELNLGFYGKKNNFTTGVWMRQTMNNSDAVIFMMGYKYNHLAFGYSYDLGLEKFSGNIKSAHEISLQFELKNTYKKNKIRSLRLSCPAL